MLHATVTQFSVLQISCDWTVASPVNHRKSPPTRKCSTVLKASGLA